MALATHSAKLSDNVDEKVWKQLRRSLLSMTEELNIDEIDSSSQLVWPGGKLPYTIDVSSFTSNEEQIKKIQIEITKFNSSQNFVRMIARTNESNFVQFCHHDTKSDSFVGMNGGMQIIHISPHHPPGTTIPEILHSLGFVHAHQRIDRHHYIKVNHDSDTESVQNFGITGIPIGPYDPESIMHYECGNFEGHATITRLSSISSNTKVGQRDKLSFWDCKGLQYIYGPPSCSFDIFGEKYYPQEFYECITCWGRGTCYGVCSYCRANCHNGHDVIKHSISEYQSSNDTVFVCDCGRNKHKLQQCTRISTGSSYKTQSIYLCYDCFDVERYRKEHNGSTPGICYPCYLKCHKSHHSEFCMFSNSFFCDCGLSYCTGKCFARDHTCSDGPKVCSYEVFGENYLQQDL